MLPGSWSSIGASQVDLAVQYLENKVTVTANTLYRKFKKIIPRNETRGLVTNSYIYVSVSDILVYIFTIDPPILRQIYCISILDVSFSGLNLWLKV
jgi:hypothetical protein